MRRIRDTIRIMYIHEKNGWPKFIWDQEKIPALLVRVRHTQGLLLGGMRSIGFASSEKVVLESLTQDVIKSSAIEGEVLDQTQVRSSIARKLGLDVAADPIDRHIEGVVEMMLDATQKGSLDITDWLEWFLSCLMRAVGKAHSTLESVKQKEQAWKSIAKHDLNARQRKIVNLLLDGFHGKLTSSKWAKIANCSQDTAHRDILDLIKRGILVKSEEGGRSTSYALKLF